jgi:hypothetical protein
METILKKKKIIRTIEEEIETSVFISKDGTVFDNANECVQHEQEVDFNSYFIVNYSLENINPQRYGLDIGCTTFCHLVNIKKIDDDTINDIIKFYKLEDHTLDLIKIKKGWSFISLVDDISLWFMDDSNKKFIIESLEDVIHEKQTKINLLKELSNKLTQ